MLILSLAAVLAPAALADQRIALVIGNNAYPGSPLFNPVNDAIAVDAALTELGFEVVRVTDADLDAMQEALLEFSSRIEEDATALVFYAGHGIQAGGRNYLVPVDADLETENRLRFEALEMGDILEELEYSPSRLNIVIMDACRNNPFLRRFRGASGGLAAVDAASGTLIAYATAPGSVASDGSGSNGLYTEYFLRALREPGVQVEAVFKQVRIGVTEASGGEQVPWESSSLTGDFVFNQTGPAAPGTAAPAAQIASTGSMGAASARTADAETVFWESVREDADPEGFRAYLARYPDGTFAPLARARVEQLESAAAEADRCDDLTGLWREIRHDRSCISDLWIEAPADGAPDRYASRTDVCAGPGTLVFSKGTSSGTVRLEGRTLHGEWRHGPCSGTSEYTFDEHCTTASGLVVGTRGLFGTCAKIRLAVEIERTD